MGTAVQDLKENFFATRVFESEKLKTKVNGTNSPGSPKGSEHSRAEIGRQREPHKNLKKLQINDYFFETALLFHANLAEC